MKLREFFTGLFLFAIVLGIVTVSSDKAESAVIVPDGNGDLAAYAQQIEAAYDLPPHLLVAICKKESNWKNVGGQHGEIGVCQILPASLDHALGTAKNNRPVLSRGSVGPMVRIVQDKVGAAVDGVYGHNTALLVAKYQADNDLRVDGIVGPQTWRSLLGPPSYAKMLWNPYQNIEYAAKYLVWLRDTLGTDEPAILMAAYNGGPGHPVVKYMVKVADYRQSLMPPLEAYLTQDLR